MLFSDEYITDLRIAVRVFLELKGLDKDAARLVHNTEVINCQT